MKIHFANMISHILIVVLSIILFPSDGLVAQEVSPCDLAAAHPNDPAGLADGAPDGEIDTAAAISVCEAAVNEDPDNPRLQFQLGRAYWEADRDAAAIEMFQTSAISGDYAAAYAFLGIAYEYGYVTGSPETELARALYQIALENEFEPARDLLAALPEDRPMSPAEGTAPISFNGYYQPQILQNIYDEEFNTLNEESLKVLLYLKGMYDFFKQDVNWYDLRCAHLHDTRLTQKVIRNLLGSNPQTATENADGIVNRFMQQFQSRLQNGDVAGLIGDFLEKDILPDEGKRDAGHLVSDNENNCEADMIKRLYKNAQYYFLREMSFRQ